MIQAAPMTDTDISEAEMLARVVRFEELKSTAKSFSDTRIPRQERDIFTITGAGVVEDPDAIPPIEAQEFHMATVACEPGFRNVADTNGHLLALVGGHESGCVGWLESMKEMARRAGLIIDESGSLREVSTESD